MNSEQCRAFLRNSFAVEGYFLLLNEPPSGETEAPQESSVSPRIVLVTALHTAVHLKIFRLGVRRKSPPSQLLSPSTVRIAVNLLVHA